MEPFIRIKNNARYNISSEVYVVMSILAMRGDQSYKCYSACK